MKKQIIVATGLAVLSTSAYATKARMSALSQDANRGSQYVQDTRNIFRNAAHVNTFKNYVVTEWGAAQNADEAAATPDAEGGFFREMGAFSYGVYLGNDSDSQNGVRAGGDGYADALASNITETTAFGGGSFRLHDNAIDLFFGGDMGVQWGANLHYASNATENSGTHKLEQSAMHLGLGIIMGDLEAYAKMNLGDESKGGAASADKWEGSGMSVGASYNLGDLNIHADYSKVEAEATITNVKNTTERTDLMVGVAKTHEVSSSSRIVMSADYIMTSAEDKDGTTATDSLEADQTSLQLTLGMEAEANSWLTLRGSIVGPLVINEIEEKQGANTFKRSAPNQVGVKAGATLSFGKLKVDGMIGTTGSARNTGTVGSDTTSGTLTTDNLLTQVGVHYWF